MLSNSTSNVTSIVPKGAFEEAVSNLDLQRCLMLLTVLSQRAFYLNNKEVIDDKKVIKPLKNILHV